VVVSVKQLVDRCRTRSHLLDTAGYRLVLNTGQGHRP
jgi:hypothetical protein